MIAKTSGTIFGIASADFSGESQLRIAGLGDSLTYGWMVRKGYFDRVVDALEKRRPDVVIRRINAGIPGDTARGGLERIPSVLSKNPRVIFVQFGINDFFSGISIARFESHYRSVLDKILQSGVTPVPVTSCPLADQSLQTGIGEYYDIIRNLAAQMNLPFGDMDSYWRERFSVESHLQDDGVHPTDRGHEIMAEALLDIL